MKTFIYDLRKREDEDQIQTAWLKTFERMKKADEELPQARTIDELKEKYGQHTGLVIHIYQQQKINGYRNATSVPLTEDVPVWYTVLDHIEDFTAEEQEAVDYYLDLVQQKEPITAYQRIKLGRLRKKTGLALDLNY